MKELWDNPLENKELILLLSNELYWDKRTIARLLKTTLNDVANTNLVLTDIINLQNIHSKSGRTRTAKTDSFDGILFQKALNEDIIRATLLMIETINSLKKTHPTIDFGAFKTLEAVMEHLSLQK